MEAKMFETQLEIKRSFERTNEYMKSLDKWENEMKAKDLDISESKQNWDEKLRQISQKDAEKCKTNGNLFVGKGQWLEAIEEYSKAIKFWNQEAIYYGNRAYCYMNLGKLKEAEEDCNEALKLNPTYYKVLARRMKIRKEIGDTQNVIKDIRELLKLEPKDEKSSALVNEIYEEAEKLGLLTDVKEIVEQSLTDNNNKEAIKSDETEKPEEIKMKSEQSKRSGFEENTYVEQEENSELVNLVNLFLKEKKMGKSKISDLSEIDMKIINPIKKKRPHLRSKVPLSRIKITDEF